MTLDEAIRAARRRLAVAGSTTAALDARVLAAAALGVDAAAVVARGTDPLDPGAAGRFEAMVARRASGEPVGRILGRREFHGLDLLLSADTLEPRPDTETLVDVALARVRAGRVPGASADGSGLVFADVGTGSGAIALALLAELPGARAIATDISAGALATAAANARRLGLAGRVAFRRGRWLEPVSERCGLVVSNPPYIETAAIARLDREVRDFDPPAALDGGADGLDAYRALAAAAPDRLVPGGCLVVEIGATQAEDVRRLFSRAGLVGIEVAPDISGRDRVVVAVAK